MQTCYCLLAVLLLQASAGAEEPRLAEAREYFERSRESDLSLEKRLDWLEKSLAVRPTFKAHYEAGKLERKAERLEEAVESFEAAFRLTDEARYLGQAAYQIGVTRYLTGDFVGARRWLRRSLGLEDHPEVRRALREIELARKGSVLTADEILQELTVTRAFEVSQAELRVNFQLNADGLDELGRRQADELGQALTDPSAPRGPFLLLGHTDRQCPRSSRDGSGCDSFNLELSQRRAEAVRQYLTHRFGVTESQVQILGCGRAHPLSWQDSIDDHFLNRRVVIMSPGRTEDVEALCRQGSGLF